MGRSHHEVLLENYYLEHSQLRWRDEADSYHGHHSVDTRLCVILGPHYSCSTRIPIM